MSLNVLSTVPLRSVSVAWTNRISPDPARTSGPSSFWGKLRRAGEAQSMRGKRTADRERWKRLKTREEKEWLELMWSDAV